MTEPTDIMTISSLIRELQAIRRTRGDLRVYVPVEDDERAMRPAAGIEVQRIFLEDVGEREVVVVG